MCINVEFNISLCHSPIEKTFKQMTDEISSDNEADTFHNDRDNCLDKLALDDVHHRRTKSHTDTQHRSSASKVRRARTTFTTFQLHQLEREFHKVN